MLPSKKWSMPLKRRGPVNLAPRLAARLSRLFRTSAKLLMNVCLGATASSRTVVFADKANNVGEGVGFALNKGQR